MNKATYAVVQLTAALIQSPAPLQRFREFVDPNGPAPEPGEPLYAAVEGALRRRWPALFLHVDLTAEEKAGEFRVAVKVPDLSTVTPAQLDQLKNALGTAVDLKAEEQRERASLVAAAVAASKGKPKPRPDGPPKRGGGR